MLPVVIEVGFADSVTVGPEPPPAVTTVTVAVATTEPAGFVAVAVYVVVAAGVTACVPPVAAIWYVLPSLPVNVSVVALVAATVSVEEDPALIEAGFALIVTVGAAAEPFTVNTAVADVVPPVPVAVAV